MGFQDFLEKNYKLPHHHQNITIRLARLEDINGAKFLADQERATIGFVNRAVLQDAQKRGWLFVAVNHSFDSNGYTDKVIGVVNFRIRQDFICTLYEIVVDSNYRRQHIGARLIQALIRRAHEENCIHVQLKCPIDLPANNFYQSIGFTNNMTEEGKRRPLNVWKYSLIHKQLDNLEFFQQQTSKKFIPAHFFASLTINPSEMEHVHRIWHEKAHNFFWKYGSPNPFARILVSPIIAKPRTMAFIRTLKESGESREIMFDSGGYFVQKGDITFYDLMDKLEHLYRTENWADYYVLPDNPPLNNDSISVIDAKVRQTVEGSLKLWQKLPSTIKEKSMPVIHGANTEHIEYCQRHYLHNDTRFSRLGFGSFPTGGGNNSINRLDTQTLFLLRELNQTLNKQKMGLHTFGISTPPAIYLLSLVGVKSFDSNGWMRSGGYGLVFLPFMRGYLVTFNSIKHSSLTNTEFQQWKQVVEHNCPFCDSFSELSNNRWYRILHNLTVMAELETHQRLPNYEMMKTLSAKYYKILQLVLEKEVK